MKNVLYHQVHYVFTPNIFVRSIILKNSLLSIRFIFLLFAISNIYDHNAIIDFVDVYTIIDCQKLI